MIARARLALPCAAAAMLCASAAIAAQAPAKAIPQAAAAKIAPDFDMRQRRAPAAESSAAAQAARELRARRPGTIVRFDGRRGIRTIHAAAGLTARSRDAAVEIARRFLSPDNSALLDIAAEDIETLRFTDESVDRATKLRHVRFNQFVDDVPVYDAGVSFFIAADGRIVRIVSSAVSCRDALRGGIVGAEEAVRLAAGNVRRELDAIQPVVLDREEGPEQRTRMARGALLSEPVASIVFFPMDGQLRSAWHVAIQPEGAAQPYDILVDARSGRILLRRHRGGNRSSLIADRESLILILHPESPDPEALLGQPFVRDWFA